MKIKILFLITQSELGGAQRYVFDLANNLVGEFDVSVAFGEPGENGELAKMLKEKNINYHVLPRLRRAISPISDLFALIEIVRLIKNLKPDIIHLNSSKISILGSLAARICYVLRVKCYVIYTVHGWVFNEPLPVWQKKFYYWAEKITARWKDKLICVSEYDRQVALKNNIAPENKLVTIHNGSAPVEFLSLEEAKRKIFVILIRQPAEKDLKLSHEQWDSSAFGLRMTIGAIGNLYKTKGYEYLIAAGKILKDEGLDYKLIIIGDGPEKNELQAQIEGYGLEENIILAGRLDSAAALLPAFNIYICSSVKEGLSYTVIEAMQAGLPIIATNVGGNPELIGDGETGLLVTPQDPDAIAQAVMKLTKDTELARKLGVNAKQKAMTEFTLERMVADTKKLYQDL